MEPLEDRVIFDVIDDDVLPHRRHPESFLLISLLEVCQKWGVKKGDTWIIAETSWEI